MENNINNLSFKANITTLVKIKNKSAFAEISQIFRNNTKNNSKDILYILNSPQGESVLQLSHLKDRQFIDYRKADITFKDINSQIDSMSKEDFAKKLVSIFEALKLHEKTAEIINNLEAELTRAKALFITNNRIARNWASENKNLIARRYEVLASRNEQKIQDLSNKIKACMQRFNEKIDNKYNEYTELMKLKY